MALIDKLRARWSKKEKDITYHWPSGSQTVSDGHLLYGVLGRPRPVEPVMLRLDPKGPTHDRSLLEELTERGYDITTLSFSIAKNPNHPRWKSGDR